MPKLLWVAAPLLIALAAWAIQTLRGRPPSRHALNVWASVLLLGYVLATAALGIFWVANQQLPVFDWHYLFGYGTLTLIALHLALNFRIVWRYLTRTRIRRERRASAPARGSTRGRRRALAWGTAVFAGAAAFWLGTLRERRAPAQATRSPQGHDIQETADATLVAVERFHAVSSHSRTGLLLRAPSVDWGEAPALFKRYPGARRVALPTSAAPTASSSFDAAALGHVLWHTSGTTERRGGLELRASPSSGALFPTELYLFCRSVEGVTDGWWHHDARANALESLAGAAATDLHEIASAAPEHGPAAFVVATAVFRRTGYKYRDRTYRYVLADLGHALENLRVAATSIGIATEFVAAFDQARTAAAIGVDEAEEGVLAAAVLYPGSSAPAAAPVRSESASRWLPLAPADRASATLGVTASVHAITSIRRAATRPPRDAGPTPSPGREAIALPRASATGADPATVIAQRRSIRRFSARPLALEDLAGVLAKTVAPPAPTFSPALRIDIVVHRVAGLRPGAYRYEPRRHALVARRDAADLRAPARAAGLDQDVIGDGAVVVVLSMDRSVMAADPLGAARGYRHGFLEAGLIGERIYLEAGARRLGACSVGAFYDDEAAALVGVDPAREWVLHFVALGIPDRA